MKTSDRMGVTGKNGGEYGHVVDDALRTLAASQEMTRDEMLALAWALVDQASSLRTTREAKRAMDAIEDLYDAEEGEPATLKTGRAP